IAPDVNGTGPQFASRTTAANGSISIGNAGASVRVASGNNYYSTQTSGQHYFREGTSSEVVRISPASNAALIATANGTYPDVQFGSGAWGARFGTAGPHL